MFILSSFLSLKAINMLMLFLAADSCILLRISTADLLICTFGTSSPGVFSCTKGWAKSYFQPMRLSSLMTKHFLMRSLVCSPILPL